MRTRCLSAVTALAFLITADGAAAQSAGLSPEQAATLAESRRLIVDSPVTDLRAAEEAYRLAESVYDTAADPEARYRMANAAWRLGRAIEAHAMLLQVLEATSHPFVARGHSLMETQRSQWEAELGRLRLECDDADRIVVAQAEADATAPFVWVVPGDVQVAFHGESPVRRVQITVPRGQLRTLECPPAIEVSTPVEPDPQMAPPPPRVVEEQRMRRRSAFLVLAGVGVATMGASAVTWARGGNEVDRLDQICATGCTSTSFEEGAGKVRRLDRATSALLIGGGVITAGSMALYLAWPERWTERVVVPAVSSRGAGVLVQGRF